MSININIQKFIEPSIIGFVQGEFSPSELSKRIKKIIDDQSRLLPSQTIFYDLMIKFYDSGIDLIFNSDPKENKYKIAGLILFDSLLDINDELFIEKKNEIYKILLKLLDNDRLLLDSYELIFRLILAIIGHFFKVFNSNEIDFIENNYLFANKLMLRSKDSSKFCGLLYFTQIALNFPSIIFLKKQTHLPMLASAMVDRNKQVRIAACHALESALNVISQRETMTDHIKYLISNHVMNGLLHNSSSEKTIGCLNLLEILLGGTIITFGDIHNILRNQLNIQAQDLIWKIFSRFESKDHEVKQKVIEIIPSLAAAFSGTFLQQTNTYHRSSYLALSIKFITELVQNKKDRTLVQAAYISLGRLFQALSTHFRSSTNITDVFTVITNGFSEPFCIHALNCLGIYVNISTSGRKLVEEKVIDDMFKGGLSPELIENLKIIIKHIPAMRSRVQFLLRKYIGDVLKKHLNVIDAIKSRNNLIPKTNRSSSIQAKLSAISSNFKLYNITTNIHTVNLLRNDFDTIYYYILTPPVNYLHNSAANTNNNNLSTSFFFKNQYFSGPTSNNISYFTNIEDELIFALDTLSITEFFPKQTRERVALTEDDQTKDLLGIVRKWVIKYMDVFNPDVRMAATKACASILDIIISGLDPYSRDMLIIYQILDKLLTMGVGDDSQDIRNLVFKSITPSMDLAVSLTDNVHCLIEALNDENLGVRAAATTVLARVAHYDTLHVMPILRLTLKRLIFTLNNTQSLLIKQESVQILQALVRGSNSLIIPYVKQVIGPLMALLSDPSAEVVVAALSTIGELAMASPASVQDHLDDLSPRLIEALNDRSSLIKQETAVIAMGKLVSSLTMVTDEPYKKYVGLFGGLVKAVQNVEESSTELRLQAIKTLGLLGSVDINIYQRYLTKNGTNLGTYSLIVDDIENDDKNLVEKRITKVEKQYFSVIFGSFMKVLKDLTIAHNVFQVVGSSFSKILRISGLQALPFLEEIINSYLYRLYQGDTANNTKDFFLDSFADLIYIMGSNMKNYSSTLVKVIQDFFDTNTSSCLDIFESISGSFQPSDFHLILQSILPLLCKTIETECQKCAPHYDPFQDTYKTNIVGPKPQFRQQTSMSALSLIHPGQNKIMLILDKIIIMTEHLGEYRRDLIPLVISMIDNNNLLSDLRKKALSTVLYLANATGLQEFAGRIIHPTLRLFNLPINLNDSLINTAILSLSYLLCKLGTGYIPYIVPVHRKIKALLYSIEQNSRTTSSNSTVPPPSISHLEEYETLVNRLLKHKPLPSEPANISDISIVLTSSNLERKQKINNTEQSIIQTTSLDNTWAIIDKPNANSIQKDWMNGLTLELIKHSPSAIIRACTTISKIYAPIAEDLFNLSFHSVWEDIFACQTNDLVINIPWINNIELALTNSDTPHNILVSLLNLTEFMDLNDRPLPIDIRILAQRAQAANMFAKCLRYREIEFKSPNIKPSVDCIDALIVVNNQLGLSDIAIGILRYLDQEYQDIEIQPQWLEMLYRWDDAHEAYDLILSKYSDKQLMESVKDEEWMKAELGLLRCLHALGDYSNLLTRAKVLKDLLKNTDEVFNYNTSQALVEVQRLGANASWMSNKWDLMEEFLEGEVKVVEINDVFLDHNIMFYQAILAIHNQDYYRATSLIKEIRTTLSNHIASLLNESYSRAYRAMVTMQILAEMEEVIEYKNIAQKLSIDDAATLVASNATNSANNDSEASQTQATGSANLDPSNSSELSNLMKGGPTLTNNSSSEKINPAAFDLASRKADLIRKWRARLKWAPKDVTVYRQILSVHTLVVEPYEDLESWLELVTLCRKEGMYSLCANVLRKLGAPLGPIQKTIPGTVPTTSSTTPTPSVPNSPAINPTLSISTPIEEPNTNIEFPITPTNQSVSVESAVKEKVSIGNSSPSISEQYQFDYSKVNEQVLFATFQYWWSNNDKNRALTELSNYLKYTSTPTPSITSNTTTTTNSASTTPINLFPAPQNNNPNMSINSPTYSPLIYNATVSPPVPPVQITSPPVPTALVLNNPSNISSPQPNISSPQSNISTTPIVSNISNLGINPPSNLPSLPQTTTPTISNITTNTPSIISATTPPVSNINYPFLSTKESVSFRVKCLLKKASWMREMEGEDVQEILQVIQQAKDLAKDDYSVWHAWAVANYDQLKKSDNENQKLNNLNNSKTQSNSNQHPEFTTHISLQSPSPYHYKSIRNSTPRLRANNPTVITSLYTSSTTTSNSNSVVNSESTNSNLSSQQSNNSNRQKTPKNSNNNFNQRYSVSKGSASLLNLRSFSSTTTIKVTQYVVEAIKGFVQSIVLGRGQPVANLLQDTLRLLTLWFSYGAKKGVVQLLDSELERVNAENWLGVVPQLIARIHIKSEEISSQLRKLLLKISYAHPQALVCPIYVALNNTDSNQKTVANDVLNELRKNQPQLVEEAIMVSCELMKVAITPHELWYDGLENAAQLYVDHKDIPGMINLLKELHDTMNITSPSDKNSHFSIYNTATNSPSSNRLGKIGLTSLRDISFRHNYCKHLQDAYFWLDQFTATNRPVDLHQAWEIYQTIFKKIKTQIFSLKKLELHHVSPLLSKARNLILTVPGTYQPSKNNICINNFTPSIQVISSKQRPRRISILGSDGKNYHFLLKGHEDLRQDERVMQLFGLINVCLNNDRITSDRGLEIMRYSVMPLSNNSGVIGWVDNCDTINQLIKKYREEKDIKPLHLEYKKLQSKVHNYDKLPLLNKVELFKQILDETSGEDLAKMLWLRSKSCDIWIERRSTYTKSLAVMSMVGYILGLGDRHPSNLMLHRITGQVVHIDFGDCFEITANRSKYPEIIPFRLTRMLINAMEAAGIHGSYRLTCERVMSVLRDNRDSVMAMLEAFVYDPLISWRLFTNKVDAVNGDTNNLDGASSSINRSNSLDDTAVSSMDKIGGVLASVGVDHDSPAGSFIQGDSKKLTAASLLESNILRRTLTDKNTDGEQPLIENINTRALEIINRIQAKLTGRDFAKDDDDSNYLNVENQVLRLIIEATSEENLCQLFSGWCPLW